MNNNDSKNDQQFQALVILVVILASALSYFVINPKINNLHQLNNKIQAKEREITASQIRIADLKTMQDKFAQSPGDVQLLDLVIPKDDQFPELIRQLSAMANNSGMIIKSINPDNRSTSQETLVSVTLGGDYLSLINFANNVEKNNRLISLKSFVLASSNSNDSNNFFEATLRLSFFTNDSNESKTPVSEPKEGE